jgi:hypothetical protein
MALLRLLLRGLVDSAKPPGNIAKWPKAGGLLNLCREAVKELQMLPGIGEYNAQKLIRITLTWWLKEHHRTFPPGEEWYDWQNMSEGMPEKFDQLDMSEGIPVRPKRQLPKPQGALKKKKKTQKAQSRRPEPQKQRDSVSQDSRLLSGLFNSLTHRACHKVPQKKKKSDGP